MNIEKGFQSIDNLNQQIISQTQSEGKRFGSKIQDTIVAQEARQHEQTCRLSLGAHWD